jgi:hypothetical protein
MLTHDPHPPHVAENDPTTLPTLIFSGGDDSDVYAKERVIRTWVDERNTQRGAAGVSPIIDVVCPAARHKIDNELPQYGAVGVRNSAAEFALALMTGRIGNFGIGNFKEGDDTFDVVCKRL